MIRGKAEEGNQVKKWTEEAKRDISACHETDRSWVHQDMIKGGEGRLQFGMMRRGDRGWGRWKTSQGTKKMEDIGDYKRKTIPSSGKHRRE